MSLFSTTSLPMRSKPKWGKRGASKKRGRRTMSPGPVTHTPQPPFPHSIVLPSPLAGEGQDGGRKQLHLGVVVLASLVSEPAQPHQAGAEQHQSRRLGHGLLQSNVLRCNIPDLGAK